MIMTITLIMSYVMSALFRDELIIMTPVGYGRWLKGKGKRESQVGLISRIWIKIILMRKHIPTKIAVHI